MISAGQALIIALSAAAPQFGPHTVGNIFVEPTHAAYLVYLLPETLTAGQGSAGATVRVDQGTGKATVEASGTTDHKPPVRSDSGKVIAAGDAYSRALVALQGHETYDPQGTLSVVLRQDHYEVTFPQLPGPKVSRGVDYAYQVWIEAASGVVSRILVPS